MIVPFISIHNAVDALEYYKKVFNAKVSENITMLKDVPGFDKPEYENKIGHANVEIHGSTLYINDITETDSLELGSHIQFVINLDSKEVLTNTFEVLSKEGEIITEVQNVFWGATFGTVKDKFGVYWQLYFAEKTDE